MQHHQETYLRIQDMGIPTAYVCSVWGQHFSMESFLNVTGQTTASLYTVFKLCLNIGLEMKILSLHTFYFAAGNENSRNCITSYMKITCILYGHVFSVSKSSWKPIKRPATGPDWTTVRLPLNSKHKQSSLFKLKKTERPSKTGRNRSGPKPDASEAMPPIRYYFPPFPTIFP